MVLRDQKKPKKCQLNVDNDIEIQVTKVWVNCLVHDGGTVVGAIGSGIDLTEFIQTAVKSKQAGVTSMFVDGDGSIQVHSNFKEIDFHSLTNAPMKGRRSLAWPTMKMAEINCAQC